ncbi:MAG TPA: LamG-like jellyroll fold domain-containing protein [Thermoguttaceae bacterium]|nr:LamG-like jellyroll fold domain-containing protein [Thermoguttaceae bacterium]
MTRYALSVTILVLMLSCAYAQAQAERQFHVSPTGDDEAPGTLEAPFQTLYRAQEAAREAAPGMSADVVVNLAPGVYRLDRTLEFTEADSGRNGHRVIYRSAGGLGQARLLGSVPLTGWKEHRDGIWKIDLPEGTVFHTLYENGRRAWKARFPNYEHHPDMPTARGRYLVSEDGSPTSEEGETTGWLIYRPEDAPPVTSVTKMRILLFAEGKCDWMRTVCAVKAIDPETRRVTIAGRFWRGVKARARFFLEDELGFLDAPGEFYVDEVERVLYYKPLATGHPDALGIAAPTLARLIQIQGKSRDEPVENLTLEGLALGETDGFPKAWWSTQYGRLDGALVWMANATGIEVRRCHLNRGGRNGIMMIGHNVGNLVTGCRIEHMGVNGVTLSNRFAGANGKSATEDRCEHNRVHDCRIHDVGEIHTYAACVNLFNVSHNEVSHCELHDSVRYAVTLRGNTGEQYGPPVWVNLPGTQGNHVHHLRIYRCGQDGGDMGALHCANLNNPGGDCVNTFEQITVADSRAIPSMKDIGPDGIFLDWPKMAMDQIFRHVHIIRCQGLQLRSNRPENAASAQTDNVSWKPGFREELMDYESIGLTDEFPAEFGGRSPVMTRLAAPTGVKATATAYDTVTLEWEAVSHEANEEPIYVIYRNDEQVGTTPSAPFTDHGLSESAQYRYHVVARTDDFRKPSERSPECRVPTPPDLEPPALTGARVMPDGQRVRVAFAEPVDPATAMAPANYRFDPPLAVKSINLLTPDGVELQVDGFAADATYTLAVVGVRDVSAARNAADGNARVTLGESRAVVSYPMKRIRAGRLRDASGGGGDARLHGDAVVVPNGGPFGGASLRLDGKTGFAEAPEDLNLGGGDFTILVSVYRMGSGVILSKGNGFGPANQWSFGWQEAGVPASVALRVKNEFFSTAADAVPNGRWVHLAFVKRAGVGQAYVDGKPSGKEHDLSGLGPFVNDRPLRIGRREHAPDPAYFNGKIAGVMLLKHALAPEDISAHVNLGSEGR